MKLHTIDTTKLLSLEDITVNWELKLKLTPRQTELIEAKEHNTIYSMCKQKIIESMETPDKVCEQTIRALIKKHLHTHGLPIV